MKDYLQYFDRYAQLLSFLFRMLQMAHSSDLGTWIELEVGCQHGPAASWRAATWTRHLDLACCLSGFNCLLALLLN